MAPPRTPRHRRGVSSSAPTPPPAPAPVPASRARRRPGAPARHLRSAPAAVGAVTAGVAAVLVLGPSVGLAAATMTGDVRPEHAGRLGPLVAALTWSPGEPPGEQLAERGRDAATRTVPERAAVGTTGPAEPSDAAPPSAPATTVPAEEPAPEPSSAPEAAPAPAPAVPSETSAPPGMAEPAGESAPPEAAPTVTAEPGPGVLSAEGAAVVELTNAERAAAGCGPLVVDERLTAAAQLHSEDMLAQDYFDHTSLDGRSPWDRAEAQGYENPGAENIARGQATAEEVVRAWMDSPGHRANILSCDLREIGVGHADRVWTQLFGRG